MKQDMLSLQGKDLLYLIPTRTHCDTLLLLCWSLIIPPRKFSWGGVHMFRGSDGGADHQHKPPHLQQPHVHLASNSCSIYRLGCTHKKATKACAEFGPKKLVLVVLDVQALTLTTLPHSTTAQRGFRVGTGTGEKRLLSILELRVLAPPRLEGRCLQGTPKAKGQRPWAQRGIQLVHGCQVARGVHLRLPTRQKHDAWHCRWDTATQCTHLDEREVACDDDVVEKVDMLACTRCYSDLQTTMCTWFVECMHDPILLGTHHTVSSAASSTDA